MPIAMPRSTSAIETDAELLKKIRETMIAISRRNSTERIGSDLFKQGQRAMVELGHLGIMITSDNELLDFESLF
jgi:hypothetical protein